MPQNPCLTCGACCTIYRVSFHWMEGDDYTPGGVPIEHVEAAPLAHRLMMKGTGTAPHRCVCLQGDVGGKIGCGIHANRPSPCREFAVSYEDGVTPNSRCEEARSKFGLPPLAPDWAAEPVG